MDSTICNTLFAANNVVRGVPRLNGARSRVDPERGDCGDRPPKTYESNNIYHDFLQFGKQYSRYKAILSSIVLLQQFCEGYFISLTVVKPL